MKTQLLATLFAIAIAIALFGAGFLTGREFPRHHYQRWAETSFMFDSSTGNLCSIVSPQTVDAHDPGDKDIIDAGLPFKKTIPACGER
jgi:hypothetical protein